MASNATATVAETVSPEVLAQVAAAARQAAIPVPSEHGNAAAAPDDETLAEWATRLLATGSADDAMAAIVAAEHDIDDAQARIAAASDSLLAWMRFAQAARLDGVKGAAWKSMTGATAQEYGRLRAAGDLLDAYAKRGKSFVITPAESKRLADSKGATKVDTMVAEIAKRVDPIDVRSYRAAGKRIPGNAAIVAGSLAPAAPPSTTDTPAAPVVDDTPDGSNNGTPVAQDDAPALGTPAAPVAANGSTDTREVFTMPGVADWVRIVETMGARADEIAASKRGDMMAACEALHAALLAL